MSRQDRTYADRSARLVRVNGLDVSQPVAGFYRMRLRGGAVKSAIRVWFGPPHDPVTGEELDRFWRWQATADGEPADFDRIWPACATDVLTESEYTFLIRRRAWAKQNAPRSAYATGRRYDPLDPANPLPF